VRWKHPKAEAKSKWILWSKWPVPPVHPLACHRPARRPPAGHGGAEGMTAV